MENTFDALCSALNERKIKQLFLEAEGADLMVLMMKYISFPECMSQSNVSAETSYNRGHGQSKH